MLVLLHIYSEAKPKKTGNTCCQNYIVAKLPGRARNSVAQTSCIFFFGLIVLYVQSFERMFFMHYIVYVYSSKSNGENNFIFYRLGAIGNEAFVQQTSLRSLNMSHNVIANIDMTALKGLSQLQKMDLSYNKISRLSERLFSGNI